MAFLAQDGWHVVSLRAYFEHVLRGTPLPSKPIVLTFDDGHESQMTAVPVLHRYHFTATFFLMTVVIGKRHWISAEQVKTLDSLGYTIGAHTYDHANLAKLPADRVAKQLSGPRKALEDIVGHRIAFFAYPYGAWNASVVDHVNTERFDAAFQLSDHKMDATFPLLTLRRQIVNPFTGISGFRNQVAASLDTTTVLSTTTTRPPSPIPPSTDPSAPSRQTPPVLAPTVASR